MEKPKLTYSNLVMCNGKPVNIEDLTAKEQAELGNWLRKTPLEALGLGEVREGQEMQTV